MAACETCWERASVDAMARGGSTVEHYHRRIAEQRERTDHEQVTASVSRHYGHPTPTG